jgi:hypothetical protein
LRFNETSRIGAEITEFVDFNSCFKAIYAFYVGVGVCVRLEVPEGEELVVEAA